MRYIASCSFGKDSLGTILLAQKYGEPLDEAVYCEVMFDQNISGEVPEHRDFIYTRGIPALERMGIKVTVLRGERTYLDLFTGRITRGPKKGMLRSFPICGRCAVQRDCKVKPIRRYQKSLPPDTIQYIGIAKDEQAWAEPGIPSGEIQLHRTGCLGALRESGAPFSCLRHY